MDASGKRIRVCPLTGGVFNPIREGKSDCKCGFDPDVDAELEGDNMGARVGPLFSGSGDGAVSLSTKRALDRFDNMNLLRKSSPLL